jgi:hypothetical protein
MAIEHAAVRVVRKPWGSPISTPGVALTGPATASESYGFSARIGMHRLRPCCSSYCLRASHCRSRYIRTRPLRVR